MLKKLILFLVVFSSAPCLAKKAEEIRIPNRLISDYHYTPNAINGDLRWKVYSWNGDPLKDQIVISETESGFVNGYRYSIVLGTVNGASASLGEWDINCEKNKMTDIVKCSVHHVKFSFNEYVKDSKIKHSSQIFIELDNKGSRAVKSVYSPYQFRIDDNQPQFLIDTKDQNWHDSVIRTITSGDFLYAEYYGGNRCSRFRCGSRGGTEEFSLRGISEALDLAQWMVYKIQ